MHLAVRWLTSNQNRSDEIARSKEVSVRVVPTRVHAVFDYTASLLLVVAPWLFDFARGGAETWIAVLLGLSGLIYSLCTDYERGRFRVIPMPIHLLLDVMAGVLLAVSPFLFGFADYVWAPHVIMGLLSIGLALTTWRTPAFSRGGVPADVSSY
jgi:hypothetical protein